MINTPGGISYMKKLFIVLTIVAILFSCGLATMAAGELVYLYDTAATHTANELKTGTVIAQKLSIDKPFSAFDMNCPSYGDSVGALTIRLYVWADSYESTIATKPIATREWVDFKDNSWVGISIGSGQAFSAGQYLWTISDPVQRVGVWRTVYDNLDSAIIQTCYVNGSEVPGCFDCRVRYADANATIIGGAASAEGPVEVLPDAEDSENIIMYVGSNKAFIKGVETPLDVAPVVKNGRTLLPARFVAESLGAVVRFDEANNKVIIETDLAGIIIKIGAKEISVCGENIPIDVPAQIINGRTLLPLRAIAEALNQKVNYFDDGRNGLIILGPGAESFAPNMAKAFMKLFR